MASAEIIKRKVSFEISQRRLDDCGHLFPSDDEDASGIDLLEIQKLVDDLLQNQATLNHREQKEEVLRVIDQMRVLTRAVVYFPGIQGMENEIKNKCSPEAWKIYQIARTNFPVLAKLLEYLTPLVRHSFDKSCSEGNSDEVSHLIDLEVLQSQLNRIEVDVRDYECNISLARADIHALKEKLQRIETHGTSDGFVSEESLRGLRSLLRQAEQNCETQFLLNEKLMNLKCDVKRFREEETLRRNISTVVKRIKRLMSPCVVDRQECICYRCQVLREVDTIEIMLHHHRMVHDEYSEIGWIL